jgi:sortase B
LLLSLLLAGAAVVAGVLVFEQVSNQRQDRENARDTAALRLAAGLPAEESAQASGAAGTPDGSLTRDPLPPAPDFAALTGENREIGAWLTIADTGIDYPVVQAKDNEYYLTRDAGGKPNRNGALFLDYRVHADFSDFSNVIYGHNMKSGRMFGTLERFKEKAYFEGHTAGVLHTPEKSLRLELFAVAVVHPDSALYEHLFLSPAERDAHLALIREKAKYWRDAGVKETDRLLALSTCSYEYKEARTLVFFKITE